MAKKNKNKPDLNFSPSGKPSGFTVAGVQGYSELNPAAIVRELIQNSLDAVREDGRSKAIVRFELEQLAIKDIPAIDTYRAVFEKAVQDQAAFQTNNKLTDQAGTIATAIENCLAKDNLEVLSVLDNGIGLDERRMGALLGDGVSAKSSDGAGAIGNGHLTAIPASDLRYLLYGGVCENGEQIGAGHAILASFSDNEGTLMGEDGFYTLSVNGNMQKPFDFPTGQALDAFIRGKLDWIEANFAAKRGAAVIIPGFNRFNEAFNELWEVIRSAAACNFFAAIHEGHLKVIFVDESGQEELNQSNIETVFNGDLVNEKRTRHFLSGHRAAEAYETLISGKTRIIDVGCGEVVLSIRKITDGKSHIDLCRNGMWISDKLPRLNIYKFTDRKPFHCLIRVTSRNGEIHSLIRKSEGPLHNDLERRKSLADEEKTRLEDAFGVISDFLLEHLEQVETEKIEIGDFLTVIGNDGVAAGGRRAGRFGNFEEMPPRAARTPSTGGSDGGGSGGGGSGGGGTGGGRGQSPGTFKKSGNPVPFSAVPVPTGRRSYEVELRAAERLNDNLGAEIRFVLDESIDETCDLSNDEQFVRLKKVTLNKKKVKADDLVKGDSGILGVRLSDFDPQQTYTLGFDYELPVDITLKPEDKVVLRAEIVKRQNEGGNA